MKIVAYSDAHWYFDKVSVPKGDVLIYAGDWCSGDGFKNTIAFARKLSEFKHKYKIVVAGNHDLIAQQNPALVRNILQESGVMYLQDEGIKIKGINFYGSPWTPQFNNWAFMKEDSQLKHYWRKIPNYTNVLITHGPAYGILDRVPNVGSVGSMSLEEAIMKKKPMIHICGHIHSGYGIMESEHTYFYNVSVCNDAYDVVNKPMEIVL